MLRHGVPEHVRSDNGAKMRADRVRSGWLRWGTAVHRARHSMGNGYCESLDVRWATGHRLLQIGSSPHEPSGSIQR
jgi:hypothetical protein